MATNESNSEVFDLILNFTTSGADDALSEIQDIQDALTEAEKGASIPVDVIEGDTSVLDDLENLNNETYTPEVDPSVDSSEVDVLEGLDDEVITPEVDPETTEQGKSLLTTLHELGVNPLQIVMNIAGTALDFVNTFKDFAVGPLLDIDTAVAHINAQTGGAIPNARELLNTLYPQDLGDIDAIASALTHAEQLNLPLEEATKTALEFVKVFPDNNPTTVLDALDQMVKNHLAPDITTAGDLLTTAEQRGIDKGNTLIDVFNRSSSAIKDLGLTGDEFLALAEADIAGGGANAQTFLDTLTKIKAGLQGGNADAQDALKILGLPDPTETGEGYTEEFFISVATAIKNYDGTDAEKQELFQKLVGGKLAQKDYEGFLNISAAKPSLEALKGATADAATEMDDSLTGAVDDFVLAAQTAAMDFLSSDQIDLPGKIEALKSGLQDALSVLQEGGSLSDALTVGLKPIGFDDEFQKLESIFGNLIISLLDIVASIQDITGHGEAAAATRRTISDYAAQQLPFDLQIANEDEISATVATAVSRGVTGQEVTDGFKSAISDALDSGEIEQAQTLLDTAKELATNPQYQIAPGLTGEQHSLAASGLNFHNLGNDNEVFQRALEQGTLVNITPQISDEDAAAFQKRIHDIELAANADQKKGQIGTGFLEAGQVGFGTQGGNVADTLTKADLAGKVDEVAKSLGDYTTAADDANTTNDDFITTFGEMAAAAQTGADDVASGAKTMDEAMAAADESITNSISGNTLITEFERMGESAQEQALLTVEALTTINDINFEKAEAQLDLMIAKLHELQDAAYQATVQAAAAAGAQIGATSGGNTTTNNNNVTINTQSNAQAAAAGQVTVSGLTGRTV